MQRGDKMKRLEFFLLFMALTALLLTACTNTAEQSLPKEVPYRFQDVNGYFVDTGKAEYYLKASENGNIYFTEKGEHTFYLLCNKPDCAHSDQNCNAYGGLALGYYDNHLYSVICDDTTFSFDLIRMELDGSHHQKVTTLPKQRSSDGATAGEGGSYFFHKDSLIFAIEPLSEDAHSTQKYYKINLDTGEAELLFDNAVEPLQRGGWRCSVSNGNLYFVLTDAKTGHSTLMEGNINDNAVTLTIEDWNNFNSTPVCFGDTLYYFKSDEGLCEYSRSSHQETLKVPLPYYVGFISYTDDYILCQLTADREFDGDWDFLVFDREYRLLGKVPLGNYLTVPSMEYITDEVIYFSTGAHEKITHYVKLSDIEKDFELIPLTDPYATR